MSDFYTGLKATAAGLLAEKGRAMTLHKRTPGAYNPATGAAAVTETDYACTGAEFDFPAQAIDETMILRGDKRVILSGLTVEPDAGDMLTSGTTKRHIVGVKAVAPAGVVVVYIVQVRK